MCEHLAGKYILHLVILEVDIAWNAMLKRGDFCVNVWGIHYSPQDDQALLFL